MRSEFNCNIEIGANIEAAVVLSINQEIKLILRILLFVLIAKIKKHRRLFLKKNHLITPKHNFFSSVCFHAALNSFSKVMDIETLNSKQCCSFELPNRIHFVVTSVCICVVIFC